MNTFNELKESYLNGLDIRREECIVKADQLRQDNKADEANFEKIKINIYDVFKTIFSACEKKVSSNKTATESEKLDQFCTEYLESFNKIPASWRAKLEYAISKDLPEEKLLEEVKLQVANSLRELFITVKEG